jgi:zinc transporter 1
LFAEHSHSHDTPRISRAPSITSSSTPQSILGEPIPTNKLPTHPRRRSQASSDFSSLYGHPAATRASLVQTANEIAMARSPSPTARRHSVSHRHSHDTEQPPLATAFKSSPIEDDLPGVLFAEDTPLLHGEHNGKSDGHGHSHAGSMNMRALVLHVIGDALGNVGVIATGLIIWLTEWSFKYYCDPIISLVITVIIFSSALPLGTSLFTCLFPISESLLCSSKRVLHIAARRSFYRLLGRSPECHPRG